MKTIEEIKKINIFENNESLVKISENDKIKLLREHKFLSPYLRKSALDALFAAANSLPDNYKLLIVTAYRPIWMQKKLWRQRLWQMAKNYPLKMIFWHRKTEIGLIWAQHFLRRSNMGGLYRPDRMFLRPSE